MKPTEPHVPTDLLRRCLSTIPATATAKPSAPRLLLGDGSRKRLAWLSVAAAVPVVTVLAVLPVRRWVAARSMSQNDVTETTPESISYVRVESWRTIASANPKRTKAGWDIISPRMYTVTVLDRAKGIFEMRTTNDYRTPSKDFDSQSLRLPDGSTYHRMANKIHTKESKIKQSWQIRFNDFVARATRPQEPRKNGLQSPTILKRSQFPGDWQGEPATIHDYEYKRGGWYDKNAPGEIVHEQYFVSQATGLVIGKRDFAKHPAVKTEYQTGEKRMIYTPPYDESAWFSLARLKKGSKPFDPVAEWKEYKRNHPTKKP